MLQTQCVLKKKPIQEWNLLDGTSYEEEEMRLTEKAVVSGSEELNAGDDCERKAWKGSEVLMEEHKSKFT